MSSPAAAASGRELDDLIRKDPDEENFSEVDAREQEELLAPDSGDEDYLETELTETDRDFGNDFDDEAEEVQTESASGATLSRQYGLGANRRGSSLSHRGAERLRPSSSNTSSFRPGAVQPSLAPIRQRQPYIPRIHQNTQPDRGGGVFAPRRPRLPTGINPWQQPLQQQHADFAPRRTQYQHLPFAQPPLSYSRRPEPVRRRSPYGHQAMLFRQPLAARLPLSCPDMEQPDVMTSMAVDLDAQPRGELGPYASLDDDVQVIEEMKVEHDDGGGFNCEDYPYNDVTEDEVSFLEERPFELNRFKQEEEGRPSEAEDPEVIDLSDDDDDDDYQIVEDDDEEHDIKPDIKPNIKPFVGGDSSATITESTGKTLNSRFEEQFNQKLESLSSAKPLVDPDLFKGKVDVHKLRNAFSKLTPEQKNCLIRKRGRCEIKFSNSPSTWSSAILREICVHYGQVKTVKCGPRNAIVVFQEEKSAERCETEMFNNILNDRGEKVIIRRQFISRKY